MIGVDLPKYNNNGFKSPANKRLIPRVRLFSHDARKIVKVWKMKTASTDIQADGFYKLSWTLWLSNTLEFIGKTSAKHLSYL